MGDRHQFRAKWHDYNNGIYFVTVCVKDMKQSLGRIIDGEMTLYNVGRHLEYWIEKLKTGSDIEVIDSVIMPNHFHLLVGTRLNISDSPNAETNRGCLQKSAHGDECTDFHHNSRLAVFVNNLKGGVTRFAKKQGIPFQWQERYYDNIITTAHAFDNVLNYIMYNVENWDKDRFYKE